jgi:hypothetical protein
MSNSIFDHNRFRWGIGIDDAWTYAGAPPPKSIIIPHLLRITLPQGPLSMNFGETRANTRNHSDMSEISLTESSELQKSAVANFLSKNLALHLRQNGVQFVRCWFQWNLFQPRVGQDGTQTYKFPLDTFVQIMNDYGIQIIGVIGNGYERFLPKYLQIDKLKEYVPHLSASSREIVRHYRGKIGLWQLENEPDWWLQHFASDWRRGGVWLDRNAIDTILGELQEIVHEEDPGTPTLVNLEADKSEIFMRSYSKYCDILGLDFYPNYANPGLKDLSKLKERVREAREYSGKQIMITETGYPSGPRIFGFDQKKQAGYVKAICEEAYAMDSISSLSLWRLADPYWLSFPFQENNFGLINRQGIPKQAWFEYSDQIKKAV